MGNNDINQQFNIIVTGLDILDRAYENSNNETLSLEEDLPRFERKENGKGPRYIAIALVLLVAFGILASMLEDYTALAFIFFATIVSFVWIIMGMPKLTKQKIEARKLELNKYKNRTNFINTTRQSIQILIEKKDRLYDYFIIPEDGGMALMIVAPEENENKEEIGKFHSIYINEVKIIKEDKYSTLVIEEDTEYSLGYKTVLVIPYSQYRKMATWLR